MSRFKLFILLGVLLMAAACTEWAIDSTEQGWDAFDDNDLETARSHFEDAISWDCTYAGGHNGLGWVNLLENDLQESFNNFDTALYYDQDLVDANAGGALAATEVGEHTKAVNWADYVIAEDANYEFSHYDKVDIKVIRLTKAKSAAANGDFDTALDEIQILDSSFDADPSDPIGQAEILNKLELLITELYSG
ncbi:hypothetical protein JXM67_02440 [candidate division WOR-3 bacterium]|nr:hypothetical protein [candidate division WOR-3 bacterium]